MKTVLHKNGNYSLREARLLADHQVIREGDMPAPQYPRDDERHVELRVDQKPEKILQTLLKRLNEVKQATNDTVEQQRRRIVETAQRDLDAILATPNASRQFVADHIGQINKSLYPQGLQLRWNWNEKRVTIESYSPTVFPPEVTARKNRIDELKGQIAAIDREIKAVMHGAQLNAVRYIQLKKAATNRRNKAPEATRSFMGLTQNSVPEVDARLIQLDNMKTQLVLELEGVKSGRIKAPVPTAGQPKPEPGLINDPRFAAVGSPDSRFNLHPTSGGIEGSGSPEIIDSPAVQERINRLTERWKTCTQEERDTVEGFLMMDGVDIDRSDLKKDQVTMCPREERGMLFFIGLIKVLVSLIDRLGKKKTTVEAVPIDQKDPSKITETERKAETATNITKLNTLKNDNVKTEGEIKAIKDKLNTEPRPADEAKTTLETQLKQKQAELKQRLEEIKKLEQRNQVLENPGMFIATEKGILKGDELKDDPVFIEFDKSKATAKQQIRADLQKIFESGDQARGVERIGRALGLDASKIDFKKIVEEMVPKFIAFMEAMIDQTSLEKNSSEQYRIRIDFSQMDQVMSRIFDNGMKSNTKFTEIDMKKIMQEINSIRGRFLTADGTTAVTDFMSAEEIRLCL